MPLCIRIKIDVSNAARDGQAKQKGSSRHVKNTGKKKKDMKMKRKQKSYGHICMVQIASRALVVCAWLYSWTKRSLYKIAVAAREHTQAYRVQKEARIPKSLWKGSVTQTSDGAAQQEMVWVVRVHPLSPSTNTERIEWGRERATWWLDAFQTVGWEGEDGA
jgi:hypothetical protein